MMPRGQRDELVRHPQGQVEGSASHARRATDAGRGTHREIRAAQKPKEMNGSKPRSPPTLKLASELFHVKKQIIKIFMSYLPQIADFRNILASKAKLVTSFFMRVTFTR